MIGISVSVDQSALKCALFLSLLYLHYAFSCSIDCETENLSGISPYVQMFLEEKAILLVLHLLKKGLEKTEPKQRTSPVLGEMYCTIRLPLFTPSPLVDSSDKEALIDVA